MNIIWKSPGARARTSSSLPSYTVSGSNLILTASSNGAFQSSNSDGISLQVGDTLLVANEVSSNKPNNGVYTLIQLGDSSNPWILVRRDDCNSSGELEQAVITVSEGSSYANSAWTQTAISIALGTSDISWIVFSKQENELIPSSGTILQFDKSRRYGSLSSPESGNITYDSTDNVLGIVVLLIHENSAPPTFGSEFKLIKGYYLINEINYIYFNLIDTNVILYTISQEL